MKETIDKTNEQNIHYYTEILEMDANKQNMNVSTRNIKRMKDYRTNI